MKTSILFRTNQGIVLSSHLSRVESSANGMTNLAAGVVIIAAATIGGANIHFRLKEVRPSQSREYITITRTELCLRPVMIL